MPTETAPTTAPTLDEALAALAKVGSFPHLKSHVRAHLPEWKALADEEQNALSAAFDAKCNSLGLNPDEVMSAAAPPAPDAPAAAPTAPQDAPGAAPAPAAARPPPPAAKPGTAALVPMEGRVAVQEVLTWGPEQLRVIRETCCPGKTKPTPNEFAVFVAVCKNTGLNPLLGEIRFIPRRLAVSDGNGGERWVDTFQPMVCKDGYLAVAHRSGMFTGIETTVYPEDPTAAPTHATCIVHRADWVKAVKITVAFKEYVQRKRNGDITEMWLAKPRTMIAKVAKSQALREAFSLHGTFDESEIPLAEWPEDAATPTGKGRVADTVAVLKARIEKMQRTAPPAREGVIDADEAPPAVVAICEACDNPLRDDGNGPVGSCPDMKGA